MYQSKKPAQSLLKRILFLFIFSSMLFNYGNAQRPKAGGGGGKKPANINKPSGGGRPNNVSKPSGIGGGGNNRKPDRGVGDRNGGNRNAADKIGGDRNNVSNSGNRNINAGNKNNVGNKVNIDNSKKNVNINVDNSKNIRVNNSHNRNTVVRRGNNYRPYARPPYRYGGYRYNCYRPYFYHPYRPFVWGPRWHPWGFFVATLATTAIILSVQNDMDIPANNDLVAAPVFDNSYYPGRETTMPVTAAVFNMDNQYYNDNKAGQAFSVNKDQYYYDDGVYYTKADGGYTVVPAPVGATIKTLPSGYETVKIDETTTNYYYGGAFYEKSTGGYTVVPPTAGAVVANISEGGEEVKMGDVTYVKIGETYFQPIKEDGKDVYEVADVEEDK